MTEPSYFPLPFADVRITGPFWRERLEVVLSHTIASQHAKLEDVGILNSLKLPQPPPPLTIPRNAHGFTMQIFWDSEVGKWIEAASYALSHRRDSDIEAWIEAIVDDLARAQSPDGYLNCWYNGREPEKRWTNLRDNHELYNAGHLLEGAIAYFRATGRRRFLQSWSATSTTSLRPSATGRDRSADIRGIRKSSLRFINSIASPAIGAVSISPPISSTSAAVSRRTISPKRRSRAATIRRTIGRARMNTISRTSRCANRSTMVGHAVRAMYMCCAMADLAAELGDEGLKRACEILWRDVTTAQMYLTAGLGPKATNEGFTEPYDLPNETAYAETCASVALAFWAHRMLHLDLDGHYADVMERAMYNGALSGLSREGTHYFYSNPLESRGQHGRWAWHVCPCCTMNVSQLVASVGGYFLSTREDGVAFHLYGGIEATVAVAGTTVALREKSVYPWSGEIRINVDPEAPATFDLKLRIPAWAKGASVTVNGEPVPLGTTRGYATVSRVWSKGDVVALNLPMPPERIYAHPLVRMDVGRVALRRGPLIYCAEEADNPGQPVQTLELPREARLETAWRNDLFDGVVTLTAPAKRLAPGDGADALYSTRRPATHDATLTAIPYFLWANREAGSMEVWITEGG